MLAKAGATSFAIERNPGIGHVFQVEVDNLDVHCSPPVLFWNESASGSA